MGIIEELSTLNAVYDESIIAEEYHTHAPYASTTLNNNDEIRIPVHQQDLYTKPSRSYLVVEGTIHGAEDKLDATLKTVNNFAAFLFEEIRYEIAGTEVDRVRNVGIASIMKNAISLRFGEKNGLATAGWTKDFKSSLISIDGKFTIYLPLRMIMGFFEDYDREILNVKQELVLLRSSTDDYAMHTDKTYKITLNKVVWKIPYIQYSHDDRVELLKWVEQDRPVTMAFRKWTLYEYPSLPAASEHTWTVKTSSQLDKPRYAIIGFQTDKKKKNADSAVFDDIGIDNVKIYLNSVYYPYDNMNGDLALRYEMMKAFYEAYYGKKSYEPLIDYDTFKSTFPFIFIDCSKQNDLLKTGSVDVKLEFKKKSGTFAANTNAYCLMMSDCVMQYLPLTGTVRPSV